jgi:alanine-glyoxylate transaminase/serine-glyoxylate transaminase/serine-pyruvate transaminase
LRQIARERFQVGLAGGLGPMTGRAFRIGHLGDQNEATILGCLTGVEATLAALEVPRGEGAIAAAIATLQD